jgi:hypothetical protein
MNDCQYNQVYLRRENFVKVNFPTSLLIPKIKTGELFPSDLISVDSKIWVRLDSHKQLTKFFIKKDGFKNQKQPEALKEKKTNVTHKTNNEAKDITSIWSIRIAYTFAFNTSFYTLLSATPQNPIYILDVLLSAALAIGIYRNSFKCAVTMLGYFFASKWIQFLSTPDFSTRDICISLIVLYAYALGVLGIYKTHKKKSLLLSN